MMRVLACAVAACVAAAAGTPGGDTCAAAGGEGSCAPSVVGDHSLLQVHPAKKSIAAIEKNSVEHKSSKGARAKLQQEKAVKGSAPAAGVGEDSAGVLRMPDDWSLDTDYPNDMKGTHANTLRELQNATQPGPGDLGRKTEPGLKDSWNVDTMFATDSDGPSPMSQRAMIAWGYPSKVGQDETVKAEKKENTTGLKSNETSLSVNTTGLQQVKAVQGNAPGVGEDKAGVLRAPDDYDLESDYPNDMKGTHANTLREMQNATQPGAGDVDRKTEPGLKDSWNVDTMFPTDSDGAGHLSQKGMIAWGYPSKVGQAETVNTVNTVKTVKTENTTGLVGNETANTTGLQQVKAVQGNDTGLTANTTGLLGEAAKALKNGTASHENGTSH